ncbi:hypothetical protein GCM10022236_32660 [Microlunatus ginsengisoli]|uniref:Rhomboid family intramembrane serine protease n=1 Tax=Microlunatus ginsengisoli TaxID=363863 RepID=A0ABP7AA05_9ACTN
MEQARADNAEVINEPGPGSGRTAALLTWLRRQWPVPFRPWAHGRDVAILYSTMVVVISLMIAIQPPHRLAALVEQSSTNLANMAAHPFAVLFLSAFVVSPATGLILIVPVLICYGEVQRWLGRVSTILVIVFGHVGATLVVMMLEITALHRHIVGFSVVVKPDVGVSYGMFAAIGALLFRVPPSWRTVYGLATLAVIAVLVIWFRDFTNLGHAAAYLIGISLSWLLHTAALRRPAMVQTGRKSAIVT